MNTIPQMALLIDAENVSSRLLHTVMPRLLKRGKVPVRRAYANWRKKLCPDWNEVASRYALRGIQQFDPVSGKNATDMALTVDAMELFHSGRFDTFALVSNDGDFTPLAIRLREAGATVLGFGNKAHATAFANACDSFEVINISDEAPEKAEEKTAEKKQKPKVATAPKKKEQAVPPSLINKVGLWFEEAFEELAKNDKGCVLIGLANTHIRRKHPHYSLKELGFARPSTFLKSLPQQFELQEGNACYRLKSKQTVPTA